MHFPLSSFNLRERERSEIESPFLDKCPWPLKPITVKGSSAFTSVCMPVAVFKTAKAPSMTFIAIWPLRFSPNSPAGPISPAVVKVYSPALICTPSPFLKLKRIRPWSTSMTRALLLRVNLAVALVISILLPLIKEISAGSFDVT